MKPAYPANRAQPGDIGPQNRKNKGKEAEKTALSDELDFYASAHRFRRDHPRNDVVEPIAILVARLALRQTNPNLRGPRADHGSRSPALAVRRVPDTKSGCTGR